MQPQNVFLQPFIRDQVTKVSAPAIPFFKLMYGVSPAAWCIWDSEQMSI